MSAGRNRRRLLCPRLLETVASTSLRASHGSDALGSSSYPRLGLGATAVNGEQLVQGLGDLAGMMGPTLQAVRNEQVVTMQFQAMGERGAGEGRERGLATSHMEERSSWPSHA